MINQIQKYNSHIGGDEVRLKNHSIVSTGVLTICTKWGSDQTCWQSIIEHKNPIPKLNNENKLFGI
jgi:hypothetical protein